MSVYDFIREGRYKNTVPYDITPEPVDEERMTVRQAREHVLAQQQRKIEQRRIYQAESNRLDDLFWADAEAECGTAGHPKAAKLRSIAYEYGHSSGYEEIYGYYSELAELLK